MRKHPSRITHLLTLLTLTVFSLYMLLVLLTGASFYKDLVQQGEASYARRTKLQYLTTRVRQAETVKAGTFHGCNALILEETIQGERYITHIYCYDGWLRELYAVSEAKLPIQAGTAILEAESLSAKQEKGLLTLTLDSETLFLYRPDYKEGAS